jgi:hypothetical protein
MSQKHEAVRVYAVLASTAEEALKTVSANLSSKAQVEIVGGLSRDLVKRLHLKLEEMLQV